MVWLMTLLRHDDQLIQVIALPTQLADEVTHTVDNAALSTIVSSPPGGSRCIPSRQVLQARSLHVLDARQNHITSAADHTGQGVSGFAGFGSFVFLPSCTHPAHVE